MKKKYVPKSGWADYGKYSAIAFQMIIIILLGTFFGKFLDSKFNFYKPTLTVIFALISIMLALYIALKEK